MTKKSFSGLMSPMNQRTKQSAAEQAKTGSTGMQKDIQLLHDRNHPNALTLSVQGKPAPVVVKNDADLAQLIQPYQRGKTTPAAAAAANAKEMGLTGHIARLNSPIGKAQQAIQREQLAIIADLKEQAALAQYRKEVLKQLFLLNVRRMKIAERRAKTRETIAANERQDQKSLARAKEVAAQSHTSAPISAMSDEALRRYLLSSYDQAIQDLQNEIDDSLDEAEKLGEEITAHLAAGEEIQERFGLLATNLDNLDAHSQSLESLPHQERVHATQNGLLDIQAKMAQLTTNILQLANQGQDHEASQLMNHLDGLHIEAEGMQTMLDHAHSKCHYFTEEGHSTDAYHKAAFIAPKDQHIHRDKATGQLLLLEKGQKPEDMSAEEKAAAHAKFEQFKPGFCNARGKVKQYHDTEMRDYENTQKDLVERSEKMQQHILQLTDERNKLMALRATAMTGLDVARTDLSNTTEPMPTPGSAPTPQPGQTMVNPQPSPPPSDRHMLQLMRINPTQEAIDRYKNSKTLPNGEPDRLAQEAITNTIKPGQPIPITVIHNLLTTLARLPQPSTAPNPLSTTLSPLAKKPKQDEEPSPSTAPSPFSTTPYPR
ncbi:hypothetical protein BN59_02984 [Legionella massiliensis]|uniref:LidA long coiled-coil domain-containing protein n=1 Tax=Legionella massiliensis TaxID=1034943 RepID=A0A078L075_9GAMM|nr:hypothetical protein [Legionella massiliensis]CDZ78672.1 hypothetical protein BN59_02984 [Legionella massiliensis]CEE14410.1 hypothetical protein BN1094_02984 [Legionella massiliensis]